MKLFTIAAAGMALLVGAASATPVPAQTVRERTVVTTSGPQTSVRQRTTVTTRTTVREDRPRYRPRYRTVCKTRYRQGERIRTCRRVRVYR